MDNKKQITQGSPVNVFGTVTQKTQRENVIMPPPPSRPRSFPKLETSRYARVPLYFFRYSETKKRQNCDNPLFAEFFGYRTFLAKVRSKKFYNFS